MSDPQRRRVRVRRSPKISVFLLIGAVAGALVAIVAVNVTPADPTTPTIQTAAFLAALLAPVGALIAGALGLVLDRVAERRSKIVEAERIPPEFRAAAPLPDDAAEAPAPKTTGDDAAQ